MYCNGCARRWCVARKRCSGWCGETYGTSASSTEAYAAMRNLEARRAEEAARGGYFGGIRLTEEQAIMDSLNVRARTLRMSEVQVLMDEMSRASTNLRGYPPPRARTSQESRQNRGVGD